MPKLIKKIILVLPYLILFLIFGLPWLRLDFSAEMIQTFGDKLIHFVVYGCLSFSYCLRFSVLGKKPEKNLWKIIIFIILIGAIDEGIQAFVPFRFSSLGDFLADSLGAVIFPFIFIQMRLPTLLKRKLNFNN